MSENKNVNYGRIPSETKNIDGAHYEDGVLAGSHMLPAPDRYDGKNHIFHKNGRIYHKE